LTAGKALEIAGQITAGLAAAHAKGVLHRDIKPGNILIDRLGHAKLADFGLAIATGSADGAEIAGTPGFIAPEILDSGTYTVQSDLYSLGVLFRLFTRIAPPEDGRKRYSLLRKHTRDLSDVARRTILQCLDIDPQQRPRSAVDLLKNLPVENPLEAALARGEIPTPEMVAAAGSEEPITRVRGWTVSAAITLMVSGIWLLAPYGSLLGVDPPVLSPTEMISKSREYLREFGYKTERVPNVVILNNNSSMLDFLSFHGSKDQKRNIATIGQGSLVLTYRQSNGQSLLPEGIINGVGGLEESSYASATDPSPLSPGMVLADVDSNGHLLRFLANPNQGSAELTILGGNSSENRVDLNSVITTTGVDPHSLKEIAASGIQRPTPPFPFTERRSFVGNYVGQPATPIRLEVAYWGSRLNWIEVRAPWNVPGTSAGMPGLAKTGIPAIIFSHCFLQFLWPATTFG
jgi:serine/threonine protein kinase